MESRLPRSPDFGSRHPGPEWMDLGLSESQKRQNYHEIDRINRFMGVYEALFRTLVRVSKGYAHKPLRILECGSGSGASMVALLKKAQKRHLLWEWTAVDVDPLACALAKEKLANAGLSNQARVVQDKAERVLATQGPFDVMVGSLFLHHLSSSEILELWTFAQSHLRLGMIWDDLERRPLSFYGFRLLSFVLDFSEVSRHDGALSILRSFKRNDWISMAENSGWNSWEIKKKALAGRVIFSATTQHL